MALFEVGDLVVSREADPGIKAGGVYLVEGITDGGLTIVFRDDAGALRYRYHHDYVHYEIPETPATNRTRAGNLLREAAEIVDGARNTTHGHKERSFRAIAELWTTYLGSRPDEAAPLLPSDVAAMMVLLKFARSQWGEHVEDHGVDACGYSAVWGELREAEVVEEGPF